MFRQGHDEYIWRQAGAGLEGSNCNNQVNCGVETLQTMITTVTRMDNLNL